MQQRRLAIHVPRDIDGPGRERAAVDRSIAGDLQGERCRECGERGTGRSDGDDLTARQDGAGLVKGDGGRPGKPGSEKSGNE